MGLFKSSCKEIVMKIESIAVHDGVFHADDVFAVAIVRLLYPHIKIIRSRSSEELQNVDLRIDVGGVNDHESGDFDHHLTEGAGVRNNSIPYASCGLIWKKFGIRLAKTKFCFEHIDKKIIQSIDAIDCGFSYGEDELQFIHFNVSDIIDSFNPVWHQENVDHDTAFLEAVGVAERILSNELVKAEGFEKSREYIYSILDETDNPFYVVLDKYVPWQQIITRETDLLFVIFPSTTGDWRVRCVPRHLGSFESRKPLPRTWAGLRETELAEVCGISDALFCHPACFIAGAGSLEGALAMVEAAL